LKHLVARLSRAIWETYGECPCNIIDASTPVLRLLGGVVTLAVVKPTKWWWIQPLAISSHYQLQASLTRMTLHLSRYIGLVLFWPKRADAVPLGRQVWVWRCPNHVALAVHHKRSIPIYGHNGL